MESLKYESPEAIAHVWPEGHGWAGRVYMKRENLVYYLHARNEDSAKAEALRLSSISNPDEQWIETTLMT